MNEDALKHGAFSWNELMVNDPEGATQFYAG
jgi:predicted enzyme related to lactoylglutathione lyase